ncbi:MAG: anti-sigma factor [Anaerolineae bacterium]|nr:anti-sigma factor [Anaerolineae bacterium]
MDRNTLLELIPAYALGALDEVERQEVEVWLETDAEARQLLIEYEAVADVLAFAVSARQVPSTTRTGLEQRLAARRSGQSNHIEAIPPQSETPEKSNVRSISRLWISLGAAAAVFIVIVVGFIVIQRANQLSPEEQRIAAVRDLYYSLVDAEGTQRIPIDAVMEGVQGDLVISPDGEDVILRLAELPLIEENQAYELWALEEAGLQSAGLYYWADGHGPYYLQLDLSRPIDLYQQLGMSIEPEEGSPLGNAPSGPQIWGLVLATQQ